ncbi:MAG TPA: hypothetical protein VKA46_15130 [Gemmataceae bacterium]|nr:hypothetical protein [Gemmataceae bacterium]
MTHKRSWLALGALLAAIIGGTVWAAEQEKKPSDLSQGQAPASCPAAVYCDDPHPPTPAHMAQPCCPVTGGCDGAKCRTIIATSPPADPPLTKEKTCCEGKCCKEKCCAAEKVQGCCGEGKCCGCCEKAKEGTSLPIPPGSSYQVLIAPPPPCVAPSPADLTASYPVWNVPPAPPMPLLPPQTVQMPAYPGVAQYYPTSSPVGPPLPPVPQSACVAARPQSNPWQLRAVVEKDHPCLVMQVTAGGEDACAYCDNMVVKIGNESLKMAVADKQVQVSGSFLKGSADTITRNTADGSILLEGHVKVKYEKDGQKAEVSAEHVVVGVADGRLEVKPVEHSQVLSIWIGAGFGFFH